MPQDNRKFEPEKQSERETPPRPEKNAESGPSQYGDHPFLGNDRQPIKKQLLHFPERPEIDPMTHLPADAAREASRQAFGAAPHDPSVDYQAPNPVAVMPRANATLKLAGSLVALLLFVVVLWFMFHNWMSPSARHPGEQKQGQGLEQKIP